LFLHEVVYPAALVEWTPPSEDGEASAENEQ
jgi:hypothetical protein